MTRRRFLSAVGAAGIVLAGSTTPVSSAVLGGGGRRTGWRLRCAASSGNEGLLGLIESEGGIGVYRIEEWPDHSLRLLELVEISSVPEGFYPTTLVSRRDAGVLVSGSKTVSVGDMSICPGLDDVFAGDIEALQRMSAWELTSYEQRTPRLRVVPSLLGLNGEEETLPVTGQASYTEVVDAVEGRGGALTLLIAGGGDSLEAGYANRVELWSARRGRWNSELVADGVGHSGPHFLAADGDGTITALVHRHDGSVESWQRGPGRRRLDTTDERAALTSRSDGRSAVVGPRGDDLTVTDPATGQTEVADGVDTSRFGDDWNLAPLRHIVAGGTAIGSPATGYQTISL